MRRIAVVGSGGAGKSTFARSLGERLGLPVIHLDRHYWKPAWVETPTAEWVALQQELYAADAWIADGNYGGTIDLRLERVDAVIILALPRALCLRRVLRRTWRDYGRDIQAPGCRERIGPRFYLWIWRFPRQSRPRLDTAIARYPHVQVIELRSPAEVAGFLAGQ